MIAAVFFRPPVTLCLLPRWRKTAPAVVRALNSAPRQPVDYTGYFTKLRSPVRRLCVTLVAIGVSGASWAQAPLIYPARTVRVAMGFAPGGGTDVVARLLAQKMTESTGQSFIVENRPGVGRNIAINPAIYGARLPFNVIRDLLPVSEVAAQSFIAHVSPASPAKSVTELIALARAKPAAIHYASAGTSSTAHRLAALFAGMTQIRVTHVPYKGAPQGRLAVMAHECDFMFDGLLAALPLIKAGRLRGLGVTGVKRSAVAPEIPTIAEAGVPGYSGDARYGLFAPRGTPPAVVARLNAVIGQSLQTIERRERLLAQGVEVVGSTQAMFAADLKAETEKWARVVKDAGIKTD
jgi:tripartite-type tricarboxylate transporter receptor subunit TctC